MKCERCEVTIHEEDNKKAHPNGPHKRCCPETWPAWLKDHFADPNTWKRATQRHALAMRVLAVANTRVEGAWSAYIDAVPGMNHAAEEEEVLRHGSKLSEGVARLLFPLFNELSYVD